MALEAGVKPETVRMIMDNELQQLPDEISLVVRFTDLVMQHDVLANDLRDEIIGLYGDTGLITLGLTISSARVFPALKYTLGYGQACQRIDVDQTSLVPQEQLSRSLNND